MADHFVAPSPPSTISHVSHLSSPPLYLLGNETFTGSNFHLTSIFQRQLTSMDDFILGVLSVLIISLLSDILNSILLRTKSGDRRFTITGLATAFLLNELSHLRSLYSRLSNIFKRAPPNSAVLTALSHSTLVQQARIFTTSVIILAISLFSADVLVVVFTQPSVLRSHFGQYTLESLIPVSVDETLGTHVYAAMRTRPCVTPVMTDGLQRRNYNIVYCALITNGTDDNVYQADKVSNSSIIRIDSWVHEAGADHNVTFVGGFISIRARAQILMAKEDGGARRLVFAVNNDTQSNAPIIYLQSLTIYTAKRIACSKKAASTPEWCHQNSYVHTKPFQVRPRVSEIQLWTRDRSDGVPVINVTGVSSSFVLPLADPAETMFSALYPLVANAVVTERKSVDHPTFVRVVNNSDYQSSASGLLEEDKHDMGVALLALLCVILAAICALLHLKLRPVSLGLIAVSDVVHVNNNGVRLAQSTCSSDPLQSLDGFLQSCESTEFEAAMSMSPPGRPHRMWARFLGASRGQSESHQHDVGARPQRTSETRAEDNDKHWESDWHTR